MSAHGITDPGLRHAQAAPSPLPPPQKLHRRLARFNATRLAPAQPSLHWQDDLAREHAHRLLEGLFLEDLLAYTQVKLPPRPKLECARNFWDEMGHGKQSAMHGQMLAHMVRELDLRPDIETTVWESLALANTMVGLATTRRYAYHAIGALGVVELTAPGRVKQVAAGMRRLGLSGRARAYFDLHGALDVSHARAWLREVIHPLVDEDPACGQFIAEGALMRLACGARCFERYTEALRATPTGVEAQVEPVAC
jgi:hypothetical protein